MSSLLRGRFRQADLVAWSIVCVVLVVAFFLGQRPSMLWVVLLGAGIGGLALLAQPALSLYALVLAALLAPRELGTGTDVNLNIVTLLLPAVALIWVADMVRRRNLSIVSSPTNLPLLFFLGANLISLLIGRVTWNPLVPVSSNFLLVQLAQWAIFAFSALVFWMTANLVTSVMALRRLASIFLLVAGGLAIIRLLPGAGDLASRFTTIAFIRAPFWVLLVGLAGGQVFFNKHLSPLFRLFLVTVLLAALVYAFVQQQEATSNWVGIGATLAVIVWLRFPKLRWYMLALVVVLTAIGVLFPAVYQFAGGDEAWQNTGASRLVLIERVIDVTMRNPITGLGPAGYRPYANAAPLQYLRANWIAPRISSHNNYVDIFSHGGILGLVLFAWFVVEMARTGSRLHARYIAGFSAGYVNGMLAAAVGALVIMLLADWILPFVYNIGFPGFQASVLVWLFLGGLVALDAMPAPVEGGTA